MAAIQQIQSWKPYMGTHIWSTRDGKKFTLDADQMKKNEYSFMGVRLPCTFLGQDDVLLYDAEWKDDGESYIACDKKYLQPVTK